MYMITILLGNVKYLFVQFLKFVCFSKFHIQICLF